MKQIGVGLAGRRPARRHASCAVIALPATVALLGERGWRAPAAGAVARPAPREAGGMMTAVSCHSDYAMSTRTAPTSGEVDWGAAVGIHAAVPPSSLSW